MNRIQRLFISMLAASFTGLIGCSGQSISPNHTTTQVETIPGAVTHNRQPLAQTPPLGWNSFDSYAVYLHEKAAYENLEAFVEKLKPHGYEYFVIDAGWYGEFKLVPGTIYPAEKHAADVALDEFGRLEPSQTYFKGGIKPIADRAHELGVKFGLHMMRGIPREAVELNLPIKGTKYRARDIADTNSICIWNQQNYGVDMNKPGAQEYYNSVYQKLADWGVDFLKVDDLVPYPKELLAIAKAIKNTGRPMVLSLSPGGNANIKDLPYYLDGHMIRVSADIWDEQSSIERTFKFWKVWQGQGRPGFWPDLDMIPFGKLQLMRPPEFKIYATKSNFAGKGTTRMSHFTPAQMRTFITQRSLAASPLMMGGDLPTLEGYALELITNKDMLACNQNGVTGALVKEENDLELWVAAKKSIQLQGCMGIFNRGNKVKTVKLSKNWLEMKDYYISPDHNRARTDWPTREFRGTFSLKDVWNNNVYQLTDNAIEVAIQPNDVLFFTYQEQL